MPHPHLTLEDAHPQINARNNNPLLNSPLKVPTLCFFSFFTTSMSKWGSCSSSVAASTSLPFGLRMLRGTAWLKHCSISTTAMEGVCDEWMNEGGWNGMQGCFL
eukprot:scaffold27163_cov19-Tisochrysis_lutea.AAC.5